MGILPQKHNENNLAARVGVGGRNRNWDFTQEKSKLRSVLARRKILPAEIAVFISAGTSLNSGIGIDEIDRTSMDPRLLPCKVLGVKTEGHVDTLHKVYTKGSIPKAEVQV